MAKKSPPPFRFGPPEKHDWIKLILFWIFVALAVAGIVVMIKSNPRQPGLSCRPYTGAGLWSAFGRCVED